MDIISAERNVDGVQNTALDAQKAITAHHAFLDTMGLIVKVYANQAAKTNSVIKTVARVLKGA